MSESFEYEIRKDVRNNPIVRELDEARHRELWKSVAIVLLFIGVLIFAGLQRAALRQNGYQVQGMREQLHKEEEISRQLRVEVEKQSAPDRIEREAKKLGLVPATISDMVIIETDAETAMPVAEPATSASEAVVARR